MKMKIQIIFETLAAVASRAWDMEHEAWGMGHGAWIFEPENHHLGETITGLRNTSRKKLTTV